MAGFILKNTLSEHGGVTRGICSLGASGELTQICETHNIVKTEDGAAVISEDGSVTPLDAEGLVSMNFWGFTPDFMDVLEKGFTEFLASIKGNDCKAEYLLPTIVDDMLKKDQVCLSVLPSKDRWFGVTYKEDTPIVKQAFADLIAKGVYKEKLFD